MEIENLGTFDSLLFFSFLFFSFASLLVVHHGEA